MNRASGHRPPPEPASRARPGRWSTVRLIAAAFLGAALLALLVSVPLLRFHQITEAGADGGSLTPGYLLPHLLATAAAVLLALGVALAIVWRGVLKPLDSLLAGIRTVGGGDYDVTIPSGQRLAEFAALADAFNGMARALRERNRTLADIIDSASDWFWELGPDLRIIGVSQNFESKVGVPREAVLGRTMAELTAADDPDGGARDLLRHLAERTAFRRLPVERTFPDGSKRWVLISGKPLYDAAGLFQGFRGSSIDVTEETQTRLALGEAEERLRGIAANVPGIVYQRVHHADGRVSYPYMSPRIAELTGYEAERIVKDAQLVARIIVPEWLPAVAAAYETSAVTMQAGEVEYEYLRPDGSRHWAHARFRPQRLPNGDILWNGMIMDITEHREAERQRVALERRLRDAQRLQALGTLAGGVAHEINNALLPVFGLTEMVRDDLPADSPDRQSLEQVIQSAGAVRDLVRQLLVFGRSTGTGGAEVRLADAVADAVDEVRRTLPPGIALTVEGADCPGRVRGDAGHLRQVVLNLLGNAADALGPGGGRIAVELARCAVSARDNPGDLQPGDYLRLRVADTGCGMDEDTRRRAVEPFFTTKEVGRGKGLGLSTAHSIVSCLGGGMTIASEPGRGTVVEVFVPALAVPAAAGAAG